jgi:16S rRNA G966 N2-methylase RsmD
MVLRNIQKVGLVETFRYIFSDMFFDMKYQIDTVNTEKLENLVIDSPNKEYGNYYEGTNKFIFKQMLPYLKINPSQSCFIDFGSGKGKAMFLAGELGFKTVIGVEFSLELVEICQKNLDRFKKKSKTKTKFEIIHLDASEYSISAEANVLYFANPFNETLTVKVVANILKSYKSNERTIWIIHLYPKGNMAFENCQELHLVHKTKDGVIYRLG